MPIATSKGGSDFELIPEGLEIGVCYAILDLGTHHDDKYGKDQRKVCLIWELPHVEAIMINGKPMPRVISKQYTLSLGEKANLRHDLEGWRGKAFTEEQLEGFDLAVLAGKNCQVQIIHNKTAKGTYANIKTIVNVPKGHVEIESVAPIVVYDIGNVIPDDVIPEWICNIIRGAQEWEEKEKEDDQQQEEAAGDADVESQGQECLPGEETTNEPF